MKKRGRFIWGTERRGYKHLYLYKNAGTLLNPITSGDWAVRGPGQISFWAGKSVVHIDEKGRKVYFTSIKKSSLERHLYSVGLNGRSMKRLTKKDGFHSVHFSPDGKYYFDYFSSVSRMPELTLHRRNGKRLASLYKMGKGVEERFDIQYPEQFYIEAADGFKLPAQLWKPKDFDPGKKYPVVMYHYGGPQAPVVLDRWSHYTFFNQVLLQQGYLVFTVDIRSSTAISQELAETVLHKMHTAEELRDLLDGVRWLKGRRFVDPERVGIWGWSYGGASTLLAMTHCKEFKAGIAVAALTDPRYHSPKWAEFGMKSPVDFPEAYEKASLVKRAGDLHGRLLLVHGTYDFNVRIQNAWAFSDALVRAGKSFDMMIYPMRTHGIADAPARIHLFNKMVEFWKLYL
jgi:dipeptidyl-peptidase-4